MAGGPPKIPPGVTDVNHGPSILAVGWIEASLGCLFLIARMYTRARVVRNVGWDDWTMVLATALALITTGLVSGEVHYGVGRHVYFVPPTQFSGALEMIWLTAPFSTFSACFGKISIALLLMRLMGRNVWREAFLWFIIVSLFFVNLALTIITFAQCTPASYLWTRVTDPKGGSCWNPNIQLDYGTFQGSYSAFTDLVLALFPLSFLWTLHVKWQLKLGLAVLLGLGVLATVAAAIKTSYLHELAQLDFTWAPIKLIYWYLTENWIIIICGCAPTLIPLFSRRLGITSDRPEWTGAKTTETSEHSGKAFNPFRSAFKSGRRPLDSIDPTVTHNWDLEGGLHSDAEEETKSGHADTPGSKSPQIPPADQLGVPAESHARV